MAVESEHPYFKRIKRRKLFSEMAGVFHYAALLPAAVSLNDSLTAMGVNRQISELDRQYPSVLANPEDLQVQARRAGLNRQRYNLDELRYKIKLRAALMLMFSGLLLGISEAFYSDAEASV